MENQNVKIIRIKAGMSDPRGLLIPAGLQEQITIEIADQVATYWFKDRKVTKKFAIVEMNEDQDKGKPQTTFFIDRVGKAIKKYEGKSKEEIRNIVLEQLKQLNANVKIKGDR